jgi:Fe2+ or Zn2+ uptake regulation protein
MKITKPTTKSRASFVANAAKSRALLLSYMNNVNKPVTINEIVSDLSDKFKEIGVDSKSVYFQMKRLADNKLVGSARRGVAIEYFKNDTPTTALAVVDNVTPIKTTRKYTHREPVHVATQPTLSIDIVKSTGKVRINMNGIVIEVGIVD